MEIAEEDGARAEGAPIADALAGHDLGAGVKGYAVPKGGVPADEGIGVHTQEVAGADIMAQDGASLHEEERADLGVGRDVGEGGKDRAGADLGMEHLGLGMDERGEAAAAGAETLDADAARGVLADGAEDGHVKQGGLHAAEDGGVARPPIERGGGVVDETKGMEAGLPFPVEDFPAEAACPPNKNGTGPGFAPRLGAGCGGGGLHTLTADPDDGDVLFAAFTRNAESEKWYAMLTGIAVLAVAAAAAGVAAARSVKCRKNRNRPIA